MATKERKGFPEGFEVPLGFVVHNTVKRFLKLALDGLEQTAPELYRTAGFVYTQPAGAQYKNLTQGTFLAGATLAENVADHLPVPEWIRELIERVGPDLPNQISEYFTNRNLRGNLFPPNYVPPSEEDIKRQLGEFGVKLRDGFGQRVQQFLPGLKKLRDHWDERWKEIKGEGQFKHHSLKAWRQLYPRWDLAKQRRLRERFTGVNGAPPELNADYYVKFLASLEYLDTEAKLDNIDRMSTEELKWWLDTQEYDDSILSPWIKHNIGKLYHDANRLVGQLADQLHAENEPRTRRRLEDNRRYRAQKEVARMNRRIKRTIVFVALAVIAAVAIETATKHVALVVPTLIGFVLTGIVVGIVINQAGRRPANG